MTTELVHLRCIGCGKVLAGKWEEYKERVLRGEPANQVAKSLGFERYCCQMWLSSPFKVTERGKPEDLYVEEKDLTVATGPIPTLAPLQAMTNPTTIGNDPGNIVLPPIPNVNLPAVDLTQIGGRVNIKPKTGKKYFAR
jgi:DNA-directed RNA polymerase subunit N